MKFGFGWCLSLPSANPSLLAAGAKAAFLGDSQYEQGNTFTSLLWYNKAGGMAPWLAALAKQRLKYQQWYDATATGTYFISNNYADQSATSPLSHGSNLGLSGDTLTGMKKRVNQWVDTGASLLVLRGGTNNGSTDNLASTKIARAQEIIQNARARAGNSKRIGISTIYPREVAVSPTGLQITPATMQAIRDTNDSIRANYRTWGADFLLDPWELLRDQQWGTSDTLYGTCNPAYFKDGVHQNVLGAYTIAKYEWPVIGSLITPGRWYNENDGGLITNWNFATANGSAGTIGAGCSGTLPTGFAISNTSGAGQPVTASCALSDNPGTGGRKITITITSAGGGAADSYNEIRLTNTTQTTGFTSGLWYCFMPDVLVNGSNMLAAWNPQFMGGASGTTIRARDVGLQALVNGSATNEYGPTDAAMDFAFATCPYQIDAAGADTRIGGAMSFYARVDIAGSTTVDVTRWLLQNVANPQTEFPWVP